MVSNCSWDICRPDRWNISHLSCVLLFRGKESRGKPTGYHWRGDCFKGSSKRRRLRTLYREVSKKLHSGTEFHGSPLCCLFSYSRLEVRPRTEKYMKRVFSIQLMTVDGGHDNKLVMEGGEQLFLGYLSPG